jgi:hypothetical protein
MQDQGHLQLEHLEIGGGSVQGHTGHLRLVIPPVRRGYADAQVDDYRHLPRRQFPWRAPLRLRLRARSSHAAPQGTLGFGFWNDPLALSIGRGGTAGRLPAVPSAVWFFFGSPPHDLAFEEGVPGAGLRAGCLRSRGVPWPLVALGAPAALALSRVPRQRARAVQALRRLVRAHEVVIDTSLDTWHTYEIAWHPCEAVFKVDGVVRLVAPDPPAGPLGFIAWIDNQYAVLSADRGIHFGVLPCPEAQVLEIEDLDLGLL